MEFDMTTVIELIIAIISVLVSTYLIPWLKSKKSEQELAELNGWVRLAATAAEQIFHGNGQGEAKKEFVINWLKARNIKYDSEKIDIMIEAVVYNLKTGGLIALPEDNG